MSALSFEALQKLYAATHEGRTISANAIDFAHKVEDALASRTAADESAKPVEWIEDALDALMKAQDRLKDLQVELDNLYLKDASEEQKARWFKAGYFHRFNSIRNRASGSIRKARDLITASQSQPASTASKEAKPVDRIAPVMRVPSGIRAKTIDSMLVKVDSLICDRMNTDPHGTLDMALETVRNVRILLSEQAARTVASKEAVTLSSDKVRALWQDHTRDGYTNLDAFAGAILAQRDASKAEGQSS